MSRYEIKDLAEFTENIRRLVFNGFGKSLKETKDEFTDLLESLSEEEKNEMDEILTQKESMTIIGSMVKKQINKKTKDIRYIISEKIFGEILDALNARLISNILSNLTKKGFIESAYDDDLNDFVFWVQDNEQENKNNQKPETD